MRDQIKPDPDSFKSASESIPLEVWGLLTDDEKKNREEAFKEALKKKEDEENEKMEEDAKEYFKKEPQDRIQHVLDIFQTK